ncbi:hypothetical protein CDAR_32871 [Caerostris darwini]|uniref:Uncharacterized protein n=1 Tax=Caerostris darwini TaxID=1538125 RepID=A0AAV4SLU3_9ARAC|nr:hypothetical protein CDAR_32871 [Caerostris darwini]
MDERLKDPWDKYQISRKSDTADDLSKPLSLLLLITWNDFDLCRTALSGARNMLWYLLKDTFESLKSTEYEFHAVALEYSNTLSYPVEKIFSLPRILLGFLSKRNVWSSWSGSGDASLFHRLMKYLPKQIPKSPQQIQSAATSNSKPHGPDIFTPLQTESALSY